MINKFIISFLLLSVSCFAQDDKKVVIKSDSIVLPDQFNEEMFGMVLAYDTYPQFIGGDSARIDFVNKTMKYPDCNKCKGVSDYTKLSFFVNEEGTISDITIVKEFPGCKQCDDEAVRIVKLMPKWKPAQLKGKNIKVKWNEVIRFNFGK